MTATTPPTSLVDADEVVEEELTAEVVFATGAMEEEESATLPMTGMPVG